MDAEQYQNSVGDDEEDLESSLVQDINSGVGGRGAPRHDHPQSDTTQTFPHAAFGRSPLSIDPALNSSDHHHHVGHVNVNVNVNPHHAHHHHADHTQQQQQQQQQVQSPFAQGQMSRHIYMDIARNANQFSLQTPTDPLRAPARFPSASPVTSSTAVANAKLLPVFTPTDRSLPDRNVTEENLDDAYVAFILYCNPTVPLNCDTTELRKAFRQPPKSDGKTFDVHRLLRLIEKFEEREIKTWTKLAIELGVERTADQSAQKVQQYAVRLKRWMHAMHIDAFFEYILNKPHAYYQQIPPITSPPSTPDQMRDGVPLEEDLALRALHPETRPKRGRRKTDEKDDSSEKEMPASKRPHLDTSTPTTADPTSAIDHFGHNLYPHPNSGIPSSAGADGMGFLEDPVTPDHWTAATQSVLSGGGNSATNTGGGVAGTGGQRFRWRPFPRETTTPQTPHPPPNILTNHDNTLQDEALTPTTATTPTTASKPRARRRHGPAVSSAWPSSSNPLTGKLRGRPPSNRSVRDGPFSTFPANPTPKGHTIDLSPITATPISTPVVSHAPQGFSFRQPLHLTVPTRTGGNAIPMVSSPVTPVGPHLNGNVGFWKRDKSPLGRGDIQNNKGPELQHLERRIQLGLLQLQVNEGAVIQIEEAKQIAEKVIGGLKELWQDNGGNCKVEDKIALLVGGEDESVIGDFRIVKMPLERNELEELGLQGVEEGLGDEATGAAAGKERRYELRWSVQFGFLRGDFSQVVTLDPDVHSIRNLDDDDGPKDLEDDLEGFDDTGGDSAGGGTSSDGGSGGVGGTDSSALRKKIMELEKNLKDKERELRGIREKVLRAVVK
ncbi:hypothetical protein RUND412_001881 [Rhizina undulata]